MGSSSEVHDSNRGFNDAQAYDTYRPSYPAEAVEKLLSHLGVSGKPGSKIVDLAAGTGKFTEALAARPEEYEVVAVEPHESMRGTLAKKKLKGVDVREGTAVKMNVPDGWADAVVVAQAFHWFATEEALDEIRRVLKPDGKLGLVYNIENYNSPSSWPAATAWEKKTSDLVLDLPDDGQPRFRHSHWRIVLDAQAQAAAPKFSTPLGEDSVPWTVKLSKAALWDRMNTLSQVALLQGAEREAWRARWEDAVKEAEGYEKDELEIHGGTFFYWTQKL
ncbi:S-adenosyl-L-methionine-dependent methyltransferase [Stachybotrys elegans]|uniref:S-adenosyl-L-methionine-dependent methyltransferase n=1 Tax=Stachybotrys elegans TaxID=80388 RepID=A0A8K0WWS1_9HYPO|nr:S-adenosyl-L-methionine-dependent methyltransferase [Stachybotrys elegans]